MLHLLKTNAVPPPRTKTVKKTIITVVDVIRVLSGDGIFATSAVSSAGANASGNGIFEYDVPSGYTALSTKGLNL